MVTGMVRLAVSGKLPDLRRLPVRDNEARARAYGLAVSLSQPQCPHTRPMVRASTWKYVNLRLPSSASRGVESEPRLRATPAQGAHGTLLLPSGVSCEGAAHFILVSGGGVRRRCEAPGSGERGEHSAPKGCVGLCHAHPQQEQTCRRRGSHEARDDNDASACQKCGWHGANSSGLRVRSRHRRCAVARLPYWRMGPTAVPGTSASPKIVVGSGPAAIRIASRPVTHCPGNVCPAPIEV